MHGLVVGLGSAAPHVTPAIFASVLPDVSDSNIEHFSGDAGVSVLTMAPRSSKAPPLVAWGRGGRLGLSLDGYLVMDGPGSLARQVTRLLDQIEVMGLEAALGSVQAGAFNLAFVDLDTRTFSVANDRLGPIPIYYAEIPDGCLVSTIPLLPLATGLVSRDTDLTACAELVYLGHTIGDRYFVKGLRRLSPGSILSWDDRSRRLEVRETPRGRLPVEPGGQDPGLDGLADIVKMSCRRLASLDEKSALLLSGGMDSRLILAAWPPEHELPCYSYGPAGFADVAVAKAVAAIRGSRFTRIPLVGSEVASDVDQMLRFGGPPAFPNRFVTSRQIVADGFDTALDGFMGDVLLGGSYYGEPQFSRLGRLARKANWLMDDTVRHVGLDRIAQSLFESFVDPGADEWLARTADPDVARALAAEKPRILADVTTELARMASPDASAGMLVRNFKIGQKALHGSIFQTVMCRRFLRVNFPLMCDVPFLEATLRLPPGLVAFRKTYIRLFRRHFPTYAEIPYAASLLPLRRSPLLHRLAEKLGPKRLRWIRGLRAGAPAKGYDEWRAWYAESEGLREQTAVLLARLGFASERRLRETFDRIRDGRQKGSGDLLHLAGLAYLIKSPLGAPTGAS